MCKENEEGIKTVPVNDILECKFFIPNYQRGYRWVEQQVRDLLEDVNDFSLDEKGNGFYCLQPLVVKEMTEAEKEKNNLERSEKWYEVIDGQQRLTTIFIILKYLKNDKFYSLKYSTREKSEVFLKDLSDKTPEKEAEENIDYYHMWIAYKTIDEWFSEDGKDVNKGAFENKLLKSVRFIWYETEEEDPIKVFTRLNIGKISLTNSELIKALFLNGSNFKNEKKEVYDFQKRIADEWYEIEEMFQNEKFWMFLLNKKEFTEYKKPTRIDFIFELVCQKNMLNLSDEKYKNIGNDDYRTFRYFYEYFKEKGNTKALESWNKTIKTVFATLEYWYGKDGNDNAELHNFVGYLIAVRSSKDNIYDFIYDLHNAYYEKGKKNFREYLVDLIKDKIKECRYLDKQYETSGKTKKAICKHFLLLHNIQTEKDKRFEFHLYKKDEWDIEHIDSHTPNSLSDKDEQDEWLVNNFYDAKGDQKAKKKAQDRIREFVNRDDNSDFDEIRKMFPEPDENRVLDDLEKDQIGNFALLDSSTNRSYRNAIFATKKRIIKGKIDGEIPPVPTIKKLKDGNFFPDPTGKGEKTELRFVPAYTQRIFGVRDNKNYWDKQDAEQYKQDIYSTLREFGVEMSKED